MNLHPETVGLQWYFAAEGWGGKFIPSLVFWTLQYNQQIQDQIMSGI
jgi:hypothetical protein